MEVDRDRDGGMMLSSSLSSGGALALRFGGRLDPGPREDRGRDRDRDREEDGDGEGEVGVGTEGVKSRALRRRSWLYDGLMFVGDLAWNMKSWSLRRPSKLGGGSEDGAGSLSIRSREKLRYEKLGGNISPFMCNVARKFPWLFLSINYLTRKAFSSVYTISSFQKIFVKRRKLPYAGSRL